MRRLRFLFFFAVAVFACSKEETPKSSPDAGFVGREGDNDEDPQPVDPGPVDPGPTPDASTGTDTGTGTCTGKIVINEVLPAGSSFDKEFIELYNPSTCDVDIGTFKLLYKSASGVPAQGAPLHTFAAATMIKGKGYYVVGTTTYAGMKDTTFNGGGVTENGGLSNNGQVALMDAAGVKMDGLGYGTLTGGDYVETKAAPVAPATASIARKTDGLDTEDNSKDCDWFTTPTPGAKNGL
jgi:predicted extracellular nuclease